MIPTFHNLVISSGSTYASTYIGCIKYLHDVNMLKHIKTFIGTSAGALIAFACVLGYKPDEIYALMIKNIVDGSLTSIDVSSIIGICKDYGLDDGSILRGIFEDMLVSKGLDKEITMKELVKKTGKNLVICTTNLTKSKAEYISVDTDPDIRVVLALCMSCAIPVIFQPVRYKGNMYVDGAVTDSFPFTICKSRLKETLCISSNWKYPEFIETEETGFMDYFLQVMNTFKVTHKRDNLDQTYTSIVIDCECDNDITLSPDEFNITMTKDDLDKMIEKGYQAAKSSIGI